MFGIARRLGALRFAVALLSALSPPVLALASVPAWAQPAAESPISLESLNSLVETLEDEHRRARLVQDLKALIDARQAAEASPELRLAQDVGFVGQRMRAIGDQFLKLSSVLGDLPAVARWFKRQIADPGVSELWFGLLFKLGGILLACLVAEQAVKLLIGRPLRLIEVRGGASLAVRFLLLLARALIQLLPLAAFLAAAYATMPLVQAEARVRYAAIAVINAYAAVRATMVVVHAVFAVRAERLRIVPVREETAQYLIIWCRRLGVIGVFGYSLIGAAPLFGLSLEGQAVLLRLLGLVLTVMAAIFILQNRQPVAHAIRRFGGAALGSGLRVLRDRFADIWHVLAMLYAIAVYIVAALAIEGGFQFLLQASVASAVILIVARLADAALHRLVARGFSVRADLRDRYPGLEARANRYLPILHLAVRMTIGLLAGLALLQAWGADTFSWFEAPLGRRLLASAFSIALVVVLALLVWELMNSAFERYLAPADHNGVATQRSARIRTLLPLLRNVILILLVAIVALIVLSELGVNIAPLLAGAGVVGLAVGFGSQKMVQDMITGAFILFEDSVSVGDVADIGGQVGLVEAITIRSIRLRDLEGKVHTIPFSSVGTVTNLTKEFSFYVLKVGVSYREDTDEVAKVLESIGLDLQADPIHGPNMIGPIEVLGVDAFADSAVIIKARIKTLPLKQWATGREFNRRMKKRFDELGIEMPFPHVTVYQGQDKQGKAPPLFVRADVGPRDPSGSAGPEGAGSVADLRGGEKPAPSRA